jgi:hypothetical protein
MIPVPQVALTSDPCPLTTANWNVPSEDYVKDYVKE